MPDVSDSTRTLLVILVGGLGTAVTIALGWFNMRINETARKADDANQAIWKAFEIEKERAADFRERMAATMVTKGDLKEVEQRLTDLIRQWGDRARDRARDLDQHGRGHSSD